MSDNGTDQGDSHSSEDLDTDLGSYSIDDENQLQSEDTLVDRGVEDVLDEGYSPADRAQGSTSFGTTAWEQSQDETIDQRILQEVPDPDSAYGAPDNESGLDRVDEETVGGDDPDAIRAEDDYLGGSGGRSGRLVAPDEGSRPDIHQDLVAEDVGIAGSAASAEEAAVHIVDDEDDLGDEDSE